ncbi:hypothetical protein ACN47E_009062 [Coniothyrium glycines]
MAKACASSMQHATVNKGCNPAQTRLLCHWNTCNVLKTRFRRGPGGLWVHRDGPQSRRVQEFMCGRFVIAFGRRVPDRGTIRCDLFDETPRLAQSTTRAYLSVSRAIYVWAI